MRTTTAQNSRLKDFGTPFKRLFCIITVVSRG